MTRESPRSFRPTDEDEQLMAQLAAHYGVSSVTVLVRLALRALAREAGILPRDRQPQE